MQPQTFMQASWKQRLVKRHRSSSVVPKMQAQVAYGATPVPKPGAGCESSIQFITVSIEDMFPTCELSSRPADARVRDLVGRLSLEGERRDTRKFVQRHEPYRPTRCSREPQGKVTPHAVFHEFRSTNQGPRLPLAGFVTLFLTSPSAKC